MRPVFRFAPSPNGRLHLGHAYSALLNAELAVRCDGRVLLRIEDIDPVRSLPELIAAIHDDLAWLGLSFEKPVRRQSEHLGFYRAHLETLAARGLAYPCFCSRGQIAARIRAVEAEGISVLRDPDGVPLYPGTCRDLPPDEAARRRAAGEPHSWRLDMARAMAAAPGPHAIHCFDPRVFPPPSAGERTLQMQGGRGAGTGLSGEAGAPLSRSSLTRGPPSPTQIGPARSGQAVAELGQAQGPLGGGEAACLQEMIVANPALWGDAMIARRDVATSYHWRRRRACTSCSRLCSDCTHRPITITA